MRFSRLHSATSGQIVFSSNNFRSPTRCAWLLHRQRRPPGTDCSFGRGLDAHHVGEQGAEGVSWQIPWPVPLWAFGPGGTGVALGPLRSRWPLRTRTAGVAGPGGWPGAVLFRPVQHLGRGIDVEVTVVAHSAGRCAGAVEHCVAVRACLALRTGWSLRAGGSRRAGAARGLGSARWACWSCWSGWSGWPLWALLVLADRGGAFGAGGPSILEHEYVCAVDRDVGPAAVDHLGPVDRAACCGGACRGASAQQDKRANCADNSDSCT